MQNANRGVRKLAIELKSVTHERIAVLFEPGTSQVRSPDVTPLAEW
jgi:hypothetical protein